MDQGVLEACKRRYKRKLLSHILLEDSCQEQPVPEILKSITLKDMVYWIAVSWTEGRNESLAKAWKNLFPEPAANSATAMPSAEAAPTDDTASEAILEMAEPLGSDFQKDVSEWMAADESEPGHQVLNEEEIIVDIQAGGDDSCSDDDEDGDCEPEQQSVTAGQAFRALDVSLCWLEGQNVEPNQLLLLRKWRDQAARLRRESPRQTSITSFFSKYEALFSFGPDVCIIPACL